LIKRRVKIALMYKTKLNDYQKYINLPEVNIAKTASHLFIVNFKLKNLKIGRDEIIKKLYNQGIVTQVHYIPINTHPYYKKYNKINLRKAKEYFKSSLSLPIYPDLSEKEVNYICSKIKYLINKSKKK
jgi:perosamine synthetase